MVHAIARNDCCHPYNYYSHTCFCSFSVISTLLLSCLLFSLPPYLPALLLTLSSFLPPSLPPAPLQERKKENCIFMASFAGTTQKCMACDKTVYLVDKLTADNRIYHKACFRCHHCKGTLKLGNYNSFEGVLYCRPHFDQLFKRTGSLEKSFEGTPKIAKPEKPADIEKPLATKVSTMFAGTREKCLGCSKTVYPTEKVSVNGIPYHKSCFRCTHGGCVISPSNYIAHEGRLYCKHHHIQLIKEKGNLSQLEGDQNKGSARAGEVAAES